MSQTQRRLRQIRVALAEQRAELELLARLQTPSDYAHPLIDNTLSDLDDAIICVRDLAQCAWSQS